MENRYNPSQQHLCSLIILHKLSSKIQGPSAVKGDGHRKCETPVGPLRGKRCQSPYTPRRSSSQRKNGPPSMAVMMPTGNSVGAMMVRASVSQKIKNAPPKSSEAGIK